MAGPTFLPRVLRALVPSASAISLLFGCLAWYTSSALSSTTSKAILSAPKHRPPNPDLAPPVAPFPLPVTLTWIQFLFVHVFCLLACCKPLLGRHVVSSVAPPRWSRILEVGQLSVFTVVGHALSSLAVSRIPVATVQTIKALSPLFTVVAYAGLFGATYHSRTWFSLLPLTLGVMMACTGKALLTQPGSKGGLLAALASTVIFVAQNIYSKKLLTGNGHGPSPRAADADAKEPLPVPSSSGPRPKNKGKLDKINILLYSSGCASVLMVPMVLYYDGARLWSGRRADGQSIYTLQVASLIWCNGLVHFAQNLFAFTVLALVSPVTYSVASLLKRVFVICVAIVWFHQTVTPVQLAGIALTFVGLYLYNNAKTLKDVAEGEERREHAPSALRRTSQLLHRSKDPNHPHPSYPSYAPYPAGTTVLSMSQDPTAHLAPVTANPLGAASTSPWPASGTSTTTGRSWLSPAGWTHTPRGRSVQQDARDMLRVSVSAVPEWIRPAPTAPAPEAANPHASPAWAYAAGYAQGHAAAYRPAPDGYFARGGGGVPVAM